MLRKLFFRKPSIKDTIEEAKRELEETRSQINFAQEQVSEARKMIAGLTKEPVKVSFSFENAWTDVKGGKHYPLIYVDIYENNQPVITKTGAVGRSIHASVVTDKRVFRGHATWTPEPNMPYSFYYGAKLALKRALKKSPISRENRRQAWIGFHSFIKE